MGRVSIDTDTADISANSGVKAPELCGQASHPVRGMGQCSQVSMMLIQ